MKTIAAELAEIESLQDPTEFREASKAFLQKWGNDVVRTTSFSQFLGRNPGRLRDPAVWPHDCAEQAPVVTFEESPYPGEPSQWHARCPVTGCNRQLRAETECKVRMQWAPVKPRINPHTRRLRHLLHGTPNS